VLRRSPTTFGVLLSFSSFAGLLTLLLLAQTTIPERTPLSQQPLPTQIVGPSLVAPPGQPQTDTGATPPGSSVLTGQGGPVIVAPVSPVGATGPSGQVDQPGTAPEKEKKPGDQPGGGKQPEPPADQPSPPGGQQPSPPGQPGDQPGGNPPSQPGVLPTPTDPDDDDEGDDNEDGDETDDTNETEDADDADNDGDKNNSGNGTKHGGNGKDDD
jgi:hypothetical protein